MVWGKVLALLLIFVAVGMIVGTGAFGTIQADRTASVGTAGDDSALLQMTPYSGSDGNGQIANLQEGQIEISALNLQSTTDFTKVFNISNHGTQTVAVWIVDEGDHADSVTFYNPNFGGAASTENGVASIEGQANAVNLDVGETLTVSMLVDTSGIGEGENLLDMMIIHADAKVNGASGPGSGAGTGGDGSKEDGGSENDGESALRVTPAATSVSTGPNGQQIFTVHNDGGESLSVSISLVGPDAGSFSITQGSTNPTISAGSNHQIRVEPTGASGGDSVAVRFSTDGETVERTLQVQGGGQGQEP